MQPGQIIDIKIDTIAAGGEGIGTSDGLKVFVENSLPGEELKVKLAEIKKNYARGTIVGFKSKSNERVEPACRYFEACGACQLQHISYAAQLKYKTQIVRDALTKIAGISGKIVKDIVGSGDQWGYRNKMQYPIRASRDKQISLGYYKKGTHAVIDIDSCPVLHPVLNSITAAVRIAIRRTGLSIFDEDTGRGLLRHLLARTAFNTGQSSIAFVINDRSFPGSNKLVKETLASLDNSIRIKNISYNSNLRRTNVILGDTTRTILGTDYILETIGDLNFAISPESFFQINPAQAEQLFNKTAEFCRLQGGETVFDLYCGTGSIALWLSKKAKIVFGVEEVKGAVSDARHNADLNGIKNVRFRSGTVESELKRLSVEGVSADVIVLDPPRSGCSASVINSVISHDPKRIVYVSCDPATLSRDLKILSDRYNVEEIQPFDMFPQTAHIECVAALSKK
ncbi:MAG: 23S rRNA (uracil(1939)-C(5))-methyltransferase RlmD [Candidatus Margulisiibacteriota bacterium]